MQFNGWYMVGLLYLRWKRYNGILCRKSRKQAGAQLLEGEDPAIYAPRPFCKLTEYAIK